MVRGAIAGVVGAAAWTAAEPLLGRLFATPYSDRRLLAGLAGCGPVAAVALHLGNGAVFGALFARLGGFGITRGLLAAEAENLALWPAMAIVDRVHPDRRSGAWPPLFRNPRVFAYEATVHALFGTVLGLLYSEPSSE
jgi:hypothetical protein